MIYIKIKKNCLPNIWLINITVARKNPVILDKNSRICNVFEQKS